MGHSAFSNIYPKPLSKLRRLKGNSCILMNGNFG
jgi:hypothetical protein